jgi:hypothetical protein
MIAIASPTATTSATGGFAGYGWVSGHYIRTGAIGDYYSNYDDDGSRWALVPLSPHFN